MPATTPNRGYPYSVPADTIDVPRDIQALATALDTDTDVLYDRETVLGLPDGSVPRNEMGNAFVAFQPVRSITTTAMAAFAISWAEADMGPVSPPGVAVSNHDQNYGIFMHPFNIQNDWCEVKVRWIVDNTEVANGVVSYSAVIIGKRRP